jgi:hypothetical protein
LKKFLHQPKPQPRREEIAFPFTLHTAKTIFRRPFTRSSTHKEVVEEEVIPKALVPKKVKSKSDSLSNPIEVMAKASIQKKYKGKGEATEKPIEVININTPPDNPTFKRLIRQLMDARKEVAHLKAESLTKRRKMKELMDMYNETLDLARFTTRRLFPLHRQLKNLYRKNRSIQSENRNLKEELHPFKSDLTHRNLNVLLQAGIERNEVVVEKSSPSKERHASRIEGRSPLGRRRSSRLRK